MEDRKTISLIRQRGPLKGRRRELVGKKDSIAEMQDTEGKQERDGQNW